ncbi:MAG: hypothetical protein WD533_03405, partial [Dehalococcoidia bacterium]
PFSIRRTGMFALHASLGGILISVSLALLVYAWLARKADAPPLGLRLLFLGLAVLLLVQFGAGTGMLGRGQVISGSHYGTALLALPLLALPVVARGYNPTAWLASTAGLCLVIIGTGVIGWTRLGS